MCGLKCGVNSPQISQRTATPTAFYAGFGVSGIGVNAANFRKVWCQNFKNREISA
jgi:hypothetical protein